MTIEQQLEKLELLHAQIEKALKEGLILIIGDMNKKTSRNFGITFKGKKNEEVLSSVLDHAITNKLVAVSEYHKTLIDDSLSDHHMISVDLNIKTPKFQEKIITSRDFRKVRKNPEYFLRELMSVKWEVFRDMEDVDPMEDFWTKEINACMDILAPWKTRKIKQKRNFLPKEVQSAIK